MIRRIVVVGVFVMSVVGVVAFARTVFGGDDGDTSIEATTTAGGSDVVESTPPTSASTEPTESTEPRVPSLTDPARVLLVGDSEAQGLEPFLQTVLDVDNLTTLTTDGRNSTGLVRSDYFDWPAHLTEIMSTAAPDIVVAFFGGNDGQSFIDMPTKPVDSPEWRAEYAQRVGSVMDLLRADGRTLIWIGVPKPGEATLSATLTVQNAVVNEQIAARSDVIFIDSWSLFSGIDGDYAPLVLDPLTGTYLAVQSERDQFHLNTTGTKILAAAVGHAIAEDLTRRGAVDAGDPTSTTVDITAPGTYTIAEGDTLSGIAAKTGTTVGAIVNANGWQDENHVIQVGQNIKLPAKTS